LIFVSVTWETVQKTVGLFYCACENPIFQSAAMQVFQNDSSNSSLHSEVIWTKSSESEALLDGSTWLFNSETV
ncbi:MAG: hypothetical protein U0J65_04340, partial [Christensenellales bacterium]|nr:hypothetical protein [Christensenellales bacterium]